jgi:hypothetical protein
LNCLHQKNLKISLEVFGLTRSLFRQAIESLVKEIENFQLYLSPQKNLKISLEVFGSTRSLFRQNNRIDS